MTARTVVINGRVLVAPENVAPQVGTVVYIYPESPFEWVADAHDQILLAENCIFLKSEDVRAMQDWLTQCRGGAHDNKKE